MAERIKGLSISLDMETSALNRSMAEIKRSFRTLNSSIKTNSNNLKFGERSVESYEKGIESLNDDIAKQRKNLDDTKRHLDEYKRSGQENTVAAQNLAREYNNQADNLNRLEHQLANATKELERMKEEQRIAQSGWGKLGDTFRSVGDGLKGLGGQMQDVGRNLTRRITMPAVGAATALTGITLVKGFDRLIGIDSAQAKLKGLGHEAEGVEEIMNSALESVKGTAFGMDEAATTAAGAVAAGVEPGKELTRYLSLTGDAAAIAGASMSEMGSIINQVQTSNVAYTDNLNQLADRGIPIYQWIGEAAGVAAEDVKDMASDGKISAEMFLQAIEDNIGGAAKTMGEESFTAAIDNMWAAVGRLGASFLDGGEKGEGFFSQLKPLIGDLTDSFDGMGDMAADAGAKFGEWFADMIEKVKSAKARYDELSPAIQDIIKWVGIIGSTLAIAAGPLLTLGGIFASVVGSIMTNLAPLMKSIAKAGGIFKFLGGIIKTVASRFSFLLGPVGIAIGVITTLAGVFTYAYKNSEIFRDYIHDLGVKIQEVFSRVVDWVTPGFEAIKEFFSGIGDRITTFQNQEGAQLMQAFQNIGSFISTVASAIWEAVKWAFEQIKWIIADYVMPVVGFIVEQVWGNIQGVITGALDVIMGAVQIFSGLFTGDFSKMWEGVKQLFFGAIQVIWNWVQLTFFGRLIKGVGVFVRGFAGFFRNMWQGIKDIFSSVITWIVNFVRNRFTSIRNTTTNIFTSVRDFLSRIWRNIYNGIRDTVSNIFTRVRDTWNNLKTRTSEIFGDIRDGVKGVFDDIVDFAKKLPGRIGDGIKNMAGKVKDGVLEVSRKMVDGLKSGVNGLISGVNWVLDKLNVDNKLGKWEPAFAWYADGTGQGGHPGGPAVVELYSHTVEKSAA